MRIEPVAPGTVRLDGRYEVSVTDEADLYQFLDPGPAGKARKTPRVEWVHVQFDPVTRGNYAWAINAEHKRKGFSFYTLMRCGQTWACSCEAPGRCYHSITTVGAEALGGAESAKRRAA